MSTEKLTTPKPTTPKATTSKLTTQSSTQSSTSTTTPSIPEFPEISPSTENEIETLDIDQHIECRIGDYLPHNDCDKVIYFVFTSETSQV